MSSDKQRLFDYLYRAEFPSDPLDFEELLISAAENALGKSRMDAEAFASGNLARYWNWLLQQLEDDKKRGLSPLFSIINESTRKVAWYVTNASAHKTLKQKRAAALAAARAPILCKIDVLNDRQYEALGCLISSYIGAADVKLTPKGNEGGIDFFASIKLPAQSHILFGPSGPLRIIGQSKKYKEKVTVDTLRDFITAINDVKHQNPVVDVHVPTWFRVTTGPIVGWIIAHSGFQSGAQTKARHHGIILSDSLDVAEVACLSTSLNEADPYSVRAKNFHSCVLTTLTDHSIT